jgi:hypothetical protein
MKISQLHWKKKFSIVGLIYAFGVGIAFVLGELEGWGVAIPTLLIVINSLITLSSNPSNLEDTEGTFPFWSKK